VSRTEVDGTTVRQPSEGGGAVAEEKLLTPTVLLHPEPPRIGVVAFLIDRMAAALEVSRPGLVLRTRELGLEGGRGRA
jgi:hypothetical protein